MVNDKSTYLAEEVTYPSEAEPRFYFPENYRVDPYTHPPQRSNPRTTVRLYWLA